MSRHGYAVVEDDERKQSVLVPNGGRRTPLQSLTGFKQPQGDVYPAFTGYAMQPLTGFAPPPKRPATLAGTQKTGDAKTGDKQAIAAAAPKASVGKSAQPTAAAKDESKQKAGDREKTVEDETGGADAKSKDKTDGKDKPGEAKTKGKGKNAKKGKGKRGGGAGRLAELHFVHTALVPQTGPAYLPRDPLTLAVDVPAFTAVRSLPFSATQRDKKGDSAAPVRPEHRDYRAAFAAAAEASYAHYRALEEGARKIASDARARALDVGDRHRDALAASLQTLDITLDKARGEMARGREEALDTLHEGMAAKRASILGTASSSLTRLDELKGAYNSAMLGPRATKASIEQKTVTAVADLWTNGEDALNALYDLYDDAGPIHAGDEAKEPVWNPPINEAMDQYLGDTLDPEIESLEKKLTMLGGALDKFNTCLPCTFENAFAKMDARVATVETTGPAAIRSARDAGLKSLGETELQLEDMIERGAADTDDNLVKQHDQSRGRFIDSTRATIASERERIGGAAGSQVRMLAAQAAAQPESLERVLETLRDQVDRPEPDFAGAVSVASRRLRASLLASAARQPMAVLGQAAQQAEALLRFAARFDAGIARAVIDGGKSGHDMIDNALKSFATQTDNALTSLAKVPGQIAQQCSSMLDPVEDSYNSAVADLETALAKTDGQITEMLDGKAPAEAGGQSGGDDPVAQVCSAESDPGMSFMSPAPVTSSLATLPPRLTTHAPPAKKGKPAKPPAPSADCQKCEAATKDDKKADAGQKNAPAQPLGEGKTGQDGGGGDPPLTVNALIKDSGEVAADVLKNKALKTYQGKAVQTVSQHMSETWNTIDTELSSYNPDGDKIVASLRGTTETEGTAYRTKGGGGKALDKRIDTQEWRWSIALPNTTRHNVAAAQKALDGNVDEAAFDDLIAAYNGSDQNDRAEQAILALSPAALADMKRKHGPELEAMAKELSGKNEEKFRALIDVEGEGKTADASRGLATYNGIKLEEAMATARGTEGQEGWLKTGHSIAQQSREAGSSRLAGTADRYHLGNQDAAQKLAVSRWEDAEIAYGKRKGTVDKHDTPSAAKATAPPPLPANATDAQKADYKAASDAAKAATDARKADLDIAQKNMFDEATKTIVHSHHVAGMGENDPGYDYETTDEMGEKHKEWIKRVITLGADDKHTRAGLLRAIVDETTGKPSREALNEVMHFESADAIKDDHYNQSHRDKGEAEALKDQNEVLKIYAQEKTDEEAAKHQQSRENKQTPEDIRKEVQEKLGAKFGDDEKGKADAIGILDGPKGNALATIELAISSEKKEIAIEQLKRMDRIEIKKLSDDYAAAHPGEKSLEQQLGINGHHWNWHNWNGATFSGDAANEIEIAYMGVPQNPKERGEVALRVMDQQTEQAGWLGKLLARDEFAKLEANATDLRRIMGVGKADVDAQGFIRTVDPVTGLRVNWGNFDEKGDFLPAAKDNATAFEQAIVMSRITADNYVHAVDRIANFVATALVVIAAVVTTALTGGAAASIWIPVLVTAAAGLVGVGLNMAIKGGRYSRDEIVRDLVATVVQAATAGIGAAAGAFLRGGTPVLKALAGSMRMSEQAMAEVAAKAAGKTAAEAVLLRSLSLGEEMLIGAGTSALASGANAAFDPAARRREDYWSNILHSMGRGALGGGLGALGARAGTKGFEFVAKKLGSGVSQKAMAVALAAGKTETEAIHAGEKALAETWAHEVGMRAFSSGTSAAFSRGGEMMYDKQVRGMDIGYGEILREMGVAGFQNFIQGGLEGGVDRGMRSRSASRQAEHAWVQNQHERMWYETHASQIAGEQNQEFATAQSVRTARPPPAPEQDTAAPGRPPVEGREAGVRPPGAPHEEPATTPRRAPVEDSAPGPGLDDEFPHAIGPPDGSTKPPVTAANDNGPGEHKVALSEATLQTMGRIAEGSVFVHPNSRSREAANDNFGHLMLGDPTREVAVYRNALTGEYLVIQGNETMVGKISVQGDLVVPGVKDRSQAWKGLLGAEGGNWILEHHYHPNESGSKGTSIVRRLASGAGQDFSVVIRQAKAFGLEQLSSRIYFIDNGKIGFTDFGVDRKSSKPYFINYPDPVSGVHVRQSFATLEAYHEFVTIKTGVPYPLPDNFTEPLGRALLKGSPHTMLNADDVTDLHAVAKKLSSAETADAHAMLHQMGMVDEPNAMPRLQLVINDTTLPLDTRKVLAQAVLEATRAKLAATLMPGDELQLLFHGATADRAVDLKKSGIDASKFGPEKELDFSGGFYTSKQIENSERYTTPWASERGAVHPRGEIFPFLVRKSQLGATLDVTPLGSHRAQWEAFIAKNLHLYGTKMASFGPKGLTVTAVDGNRGVAFDKFLETLSPHAQPEFVSAEAGGLGTSGAGHLDQQVVRGKRLADLLSEQIGFRTPPVLGPDDEVTYAIKGKPKVKDEDEQQRGSAKAPPKATSDENETRTPISPLPADADASATGRVGSGRSPAWEKEFQQFQDALTPKDGEEPSDGPKAQIAAIRAGGKPDASPREQAAARLAQEKMDEWSLAPDDHKVININEAYLEAWLAKSKGKKRQRVQTELEDGTVLTVWRTIKTDKVTGAVTKGPIKFEATIPKTPKGGRTIVYQFGDGELRVWRNKAGFIQQESVAGPRRDRLGYEGRISSHGKGGFKGDITERAHAHGAGLGVESPFAIGLAPREVNQVLQNRGIEDYMRRLRDILPPGATLTYSTVIEMVASSLRQGKISYQLDITMGGERMPFAKFAINVETDPPWTKRADRKGTRAVTVDGIEWQEAPNAAADRYFEHLRSAVNTPPELPFGLPRGETPTRAAQSVALHAATTEQIEGAAREEDSGLVTHRPPSGDRFDIAKWRDDLPEKFKGRPDLVVVDTRDLDLTASQIRELNEVLAKLSKHQRKRVIVIY